MEMLRYVPLTLHNINLMHFSFDRKYNIILTNQLKKVGPGQNVSGFANKDT